MALIANGYSEGGSPNNWYNRPLSGAFEDTPIDDVYDNVPVDTTTKQILDEADQRLAQLQKPSCGFGTTKLDTFSFSNIPENWSEEGIRYLIQVRVEIRSLRNSLELRTEFRNISKVGDDIIIEPKNPIDTILVVSRKDMYPNIRKAIIFLESFFGDNIFEAKVEVLENSLLQQSLRDAINRMRRAN